jgi:hypothetical protein
MQKGGNQVSMVTLKVQHVKGFIRKTLLITVSALLALTLIPVVSAAQLTRSTVDRPDDLSGFQVHLFYVVPQGEKDESLDVNGQINTWVLNAQSWLQEKAGHKLKIDTFAGQTDVTFLQSKYPASQLCEGNCDATTKLIQEAKAQDPNLTSRKTYFFYVAGLSDPNACGWANLRSNTGLAALGGSGCDIALSAVQSGLGGPSATFLHELLHTFGVSHVCVDNSDLMIGNPECTIDTKTYGYVKTTLDTTHMNYLDGSAAGVNLLKMPIWADGFGDANYSKVQPVVNEKWLPRLSNGTVIAVVGKESPYFSWEWAKDTNTTFQSVDCTMSYANEVIQGKASNRSCSFVVPNYWRVGSDFQVSQHWEMGPFSGDATVKGKLARYDYSLAPCTNFVCFVGGTSLIKASCWPANINQLILQQYSNHQWKNLQTVVLHNDNSCSKSTPFSQTIALSFSDTGTRYYRWRFPGNTKYTASNQPPFALMVSAATEAEPSVQDVAYANQAAQKLVVDTPQPVQITCIKGNLTKTVSGVNPSCPAGYKKK